MRISDGSADVCSSDLGVTGDEVSSSHGGAGGKSISDELSALTGCILEGTGLISDLDSAVAGDAIIAGLEGVAAEADATDVAGADRLEDKEFFTPDRKSVVEGKRWEVREESGWR